MGIEQDNFFDGLGFKRAENKWGVFYIAPSGVCYRTDKVDDFYVVRCAKSIEDADNNQYEDGHRFNETLSEDQLIHEIQLSILEDENDCNELVTFDELKKLLYLEDIEGICGFPSNAPEDEYDNEAKHIMELFSKMKEPGIPEISRVIRDEFNRMFDSQHEENEFYHLAYAIKTGKSHPCPVCGRTYFFGWEYEICPFCGWEDDPLQYEKLTYAGGANRLSAKQSRVEYYMLNNIKLKDEANQLKESFDLKSNELFQRFMKSRNKEDKRKMDECTSEYIRDLIELDLKECVVRGKKEIVLQIIYDEVMN